MVPQRTHAKAEAQINFLSRCSLFFKHWVGSVWMFDHRQTFMESLLCSKLSLFWDTAERHKILVSLELMRL